ncbi:MAG: hypothetical protein EA391_12305 [Balneolaceae bacterium]|nr:MAG: hypothetical protein EA391_12305 [Balneolaceae bacterium]
MGKYAIIIVSALIFSMITYSHALRNALFMSSSRTVQSYSQNQAHNIAHSAAMMAITDLRSNDNSTFFPSTDNTYYFPSANGFEPLSEMYGEYNLELTNHGGTLLTLRSTGRFENTTYQTEIGLVIGFSTWNPNFDQALHAENSIEMGGNDYIGCVGVNPCQVTLNSALANSIHLGSQSKIKIDADLYVGPGSDVNSVVVGNHNNVSGDIKVLPKTIKHEMPLFPDFSELNFLSGSSIYSTSTTLNPEDFDQRHIPEILMTSGNNTLIINTGDQDRELRVGKLELSGQNEIKIVGDGKLTIYVDYDVDMKGGSTINEDGDVNKFMMFYRGNQEVELYDETLDFGGNTHFNGSFFADKANVRLRGTAGIQGNVITGGNVLMSGNASAISRVVFAPEGTVETNGNVSIRGSVISKSFKASGNTDLIFDPEFDADIPDLEVFGSGFDVVYWN